jgi:hypothetical protein
MGEQEDNAPRYAGGANSKRALAGEISRKGESSIQMRVIVLQLSVFAATIGAMESVGD